MREPLFTKKLGRSRIPLKFEKYWQCVLRFGLPFTVLSDGMYYAILRLERAGASFSYEWRGVLWGSVITMFVASALWWVSMREIAARARKNGHR